MNNPQQNPDEEPLSDDPEENLRLENELLKLKMQAESGAFFSGSDDLDPALESEFLKHVQQFETAWQQGKENTQIIYDLIGRPAFKTANELSPEEIPAELERIETLLGNHSIVLDVQGSYEPVVIYRFITEELFDHETGGMYMPGMTTHYIYEEFHPNHELDIRSNVERFMNNWFGQRFNDYSFELASGIALPNGTLLPKKDLLTRLSYFFQAFPRLTNDRYTIDEVRFQWNNDTGLGHAEGAVQYQAEAESGEITTIEGPYKIYMSNEYGGWEIFYFVMPGFVW